MFHNHLPVEGDILRHWLMKSEPSVYSIDHLKKDKKSIWDGVRNYQARNILRDEIKLNDLVLFYHSSANPPGVAGTAIVTKESFPDPTTFDTKSPYYDPSSTQDKPRWFCVEVKFTSKFSHYVPLTTLKNTRGLENMLVIKKGTRLSVQPCSRKEYEIILALGGAQ